MPRYVTYTLLAFYALYLFSLSLKRWRAIAITGLCAVALLSSARMNTEDATLASEISHGKAAWRDCYLQRRDIQQCNTLTNFQIYPDFGDEQLQEKLDFLEQKRLNLFGGSENRQ